MLIYECAVDRTSIFLGRRKKMNKAAKTLVLIVLVSMGLVLAVTREPIKPPPPNPPVVKKETKETTDERIKRLFGELALRPTPELLLPRSDHQSEKKKEEIKKDRSKEVWRGEITWWTPIGWGPPLERSRWRHLLKR
jgi:hypothetical protein